MSSHVPPSPRPAHRELVLPQLLLPSSDDSETLDAELPHLADKYDDEDSEHVVDIGAVVLTPVDSFDARAEAELDRRLAESNNDMDKDELLARSNRAREDPLTQRETRRSRSRRARTILSIRQRSRSVERAADHNGRFRLAAVLLRTTAENMVREIQAAVVFSRQEDWASMQVLCSEIVSADPSEAILAKAHMLLGSVPVEQSSFKAKFHHLKMSLRNWLIVINRVGRSRYPVSKARIELTSVRNYLVILRAEVDASVRETEP